MRRPLIHGVSLVAMVALAVASTAGVSAAKTHHMPTPKITSSLSNPTVTVGSSDVDTVTLVGKAKQGSPTGAVTFFACGPTSAATPCTSPNFGPATVSLTAGAHHSATATENITPTTAGWYCFLDEYNGDSHYEPVSDNNTTNECLQATGSTTGPTTPTIASSLSSSSVTVGSEDEDTATVTGSAAHGSPTGTVTFSACGPTAQATPCTAANSGAATVQLTPESGNSAVASVVIQPGVTGWYCFLDQYSGDSNYSAVSDNNTATECFQATGSTTGPTTPTITSVLSSSSVTVGSEVEDTATVTGSAAHGSPTGTVTFSACGPTAQATPCTAANSGAATVQLTQESGNRSVASVVIQPGVTGWYCFLDQYSGDSNYSAVNDNNTATECFQATGGSTGSTTPTIASVLSSSSVTVGSEGEDTATVTGSAAHGSPTGTVTFSACGPTAQATPCTAANSGAATVQLTQESGNRSVASVVIQPGVAGWYCFLDQYSGDSNYSAVNDNNTATECFQATGGSTGSTTPTITSALSSSSIAVGNTATDTATVTGTAAHGSPTGTLSFAACGPTASATACTSPNIGPATAQLSAESGNRSTATVTIDPGAPGWYCFLDQYNGDGNYAAVSDNDTSTECLHVTGSSSSSSSARLSRSPQHGPASVLTAGPASIASVTAEGSSQ
jgi:hypothetical protein